MVTFGLMLWPHGLFFGLPVFDIARKYQSRVEILRQCSRLLKGWETLTTAVFHNRTWACRTKSRIVLTNFIQNYYKYERICPLCLCIMEIHIHTCGIRSDILIQLTYLIETYVNISTRKYVYLYILSSKNQHTYAAVLFSNIFSNI